MSKTVKVACRAPNGVVLRLFEMQPGEMGIPRSVQVGDAVALQAGSNEVNAEFFNAWLDQNKSFPMVADGLVVGEPEEE